MQQSLEIRWFFKNEEKAKQVYDWFLAIEGNIDNPENKRTDFYLNHFFKGTLGIKLRGEELEIKEKVSEVNQHEWNNLGKIEIYNKLEFNPASKDPISLKMDQHKKYEKWVALQKKRKLLKIDTMDSIKIYPGKRIINDGCSVEITRLKLKGKKWWTFCIEAYAKEKNIYNNMDGVVKYISETFRDLQHIVKPNLSMGYPSWLYSNGNL
jgi:hypothetical protein